MAFCGSLYFAAASFRSSTRLGKTDSNSALVTLVAIMDNTLDSVLVILRA